MICSLNQVKAGMSNIKENPSNGTRGEHNEGGGVAVGNDIRESL